MGINYFSKLHDDLHEKEKKYSEKIRKDLKHSLEKFRGILDDIENQDEFSNLKEETDKNKTDEIKKEIINHNYFYEFIGALFCLFHLIGIQEGIILINALFNEIVDEIDYSRKGIIRENNFYEFIEIVTYKEIPEIDVAMVTSSLGLFIFGKYGFNKSDTTFQVISLIIFIIIFLVFDFHTNDRLLESYNGSELGVLIVSYIALSILVGFSSTLALNQYWDLYSKVFFEKDNEIRNWYNEKILFYVYPSLSLMIIIFINRKIITSFDGKSILYFILIIYFFSFILSHIFFYLYYYKYLRPIIQKKEIIKKDQKEKVIKLKENENIYNKKDDIELFDINRKNTNNNEIEQKINNINITKREDIRLKTNSEYIEHVESNESFQKNKKDEIEEVGINDKENKIINIDDNYLKNINMTKICTFCGYIYLQKRVDNKDICIIYDYNNWFSWFKAKIKKFDVIISIAIEIYCEFCVIGFNSLLSEKMLNEFSYSTNIKFCVASIILCSLYGIIYILFFFDSLKNKGNKSEKFLIVLISYLSLFALWTFIISLLYYKEKNPSGKKWDILIMGTVIYFKSIDQQLLSFFEFFENEDCFNTTSLISAAKFLLEIVEEVIDYFNIKSKSIIYVQIYLSFFLFLFSIIIIIKLIIKKTKS